MSCSTDDQYDFVAKLETFAKDFRVGSVFSLFKFLSLS